MAFLTFMHYIWVWCWIMSFDVDKGVPDFWLTAMKTNDVLSEEVGDSISHFSMLIFLIKFGNMSIWSAVCWNRLPSAMKGHSSISKISSGLGWMIQKDSSWSSSLILIHISKIPSWQKHITWSTRTNLFWRRLLGNSHDNNTSRLFYWFFPFVLVFLSWSAVQDWDRMVSW